MLFLEFRLSRPGSELTRCGTLISIDHPGKSLQMSRGNSIITGYASHQWYYAEQLLQRSYQGLLYILYMQSFLVMALARFHQVCLSGKLTSFAFVSDHSLPAFGSRHLHWRGAEEQDLQVRLLAITTGCLNRVGRLTTFRSWSLPSKSVNFKVWLGWEAQVHHRAG